MSNGKTGTAAGFQDAAEIPGRFSALVCFLPVGLDYRQRGPVLPCHEIISFRPVCRVTKPAEPVTMQLIRQAGISLHQVSPDRPGNDEVLI